MITPPLGPKTLGITNPTPSDRPFAFFASPLRLCVSETGGMRLRAMGGKLKVEHSIIEGVREVLERLLAEDPEIRSVIPGVIRRVRDARGPVRVRVTVPTANGWKALALSAGARQELFISTSLGKDQLERALQRALQE